MVAVIGQPVQLLGLADRPDLVKQIEDVPQVGSCVHDQDLVVSRKDGSLVNVSLTASPIRDSAGALIGGQ